MPVTGGPTVAGRIVQPPARGAASMAEATEQPLVRLHAAPIRPRVGDDQYRNHAARNPPETAGEPSRQARLLVELRHRPSTVIQGGFQLDGQQRRGLGMKGKLIHAAALPVLVVGDLDGSLPSIATHLSPALAEARVVRVEQSIELPAAPVHGEDEPSVERVEQPVQRRQRARPEVASLDSRHDGGAAPDPGTEPRLRPPAVMPQGAENPADALGSHLPIVRLDRLPPCYPPVTMLAR